MQPQTFGEYIREVRKAHQLPLRKVAARIDLDQSLLSKIERNRLIAPQRIIPPLADCLAVPYRDLQIRYLSHRLYRELKTVDYSLEALDIVQQRLETEGPGTTKEVPREKMIQRMRAYFRNQPVDKAWLFGSFARREESLDSDVDVLVRFVQPNTIDLFDYVGIQQDLEDLLGRRVDLVEEGQEKEPIKATIEADKELIYERSTV